MWSSYHFHTTMIKICLPIIIAYHLAPITNDRHQTPIITYRQTNFDRGPMIERNFDTVYNDRNHSVQNDRQYLWSPTIKMTMKKLTVYLSSISLDLMRHFSSHWLIGNKVTVHCAHILYEITSDCMILHSNRVKNSIICLVWRKSTSSEVLVVEELFEPPKNREVWRVTFDTIRFEYHIIDLTDCTIILINSFQSCLFA